MIQAESGMGARIMAGEFWLSEAQWGAIEPLLPKNQPGPAEPTIDACSAGSFMFEDRLPLAVALSSTVRRRQSTIGSADRRCAAYGGDCLKPWRAPNPAMVEAIDSTTAKAHRSAAGGKEAEAQAVGARQKTQSGVDRLSNL